MPKKKELLSRLRQGATDVWQSLPTSAGMAYAKMQGGELGVGPADTLIARMPWESTHPAQAMGKVIMVPKDFDLGSAQGKGLFAHEAGHVQQGDYFGPLLPLAAIAGGAVQALRGKRFYEDNPFETKAYEMGQKRMERMSGRKSGGKAKKSYQEGTMPETLKFGSGDLSGQATYSPGLYEATQSPYVVPPLGGMGGSESLFGYMRSMMERQMALKESMAMAQLKMLRQERMQAEAQLKMAQKRFQQEGDIFRKQMAPKGGMSKVDPNKLAQTWQAQVAPSKLAYALTQGGTFGAFGQNPTQQAIEAIGMPAAIQGLQQSGQILGGLGQQALSGGYGLAGQEARNQGAMDMQQQQQQFMAEHPELYVDGAGPRRRSGMGQHVRGGGMRNPYTRMGPTGGSGRILGSREKGGRVPKTGTYKLHKDEVVLNKKQSDMLFPKAPKPAGGRPLASYQEGSGWGGGGGVSSLDSAFRSELELFKQRQMGPGGMYGGVLGDSAGIAGPGTVEDLGMASGGSPRSGGGVWGELGSEAEAMGQRYPGGKPMQTQFPGTQPPIAPVAGRGIAEDIASEMGHSPRSGGGVASGFSSPEELSDFVRLQAAKAPTPKAKKLAVNMADDIAKNGAKVAGKYADDLMKFGMWGKVIGAGAALFAGGATAYMAYVNADDSDAEPTAGGIPEPSAMPLSPLSSAEPGYRPTSVVEGFGEMIGEPGTPGPAQMMPNRFPERSEEYTPFVTPMKRMLGMEETPPVGQSSYVPRQPLGQGVTGGLDMTPTRPGPEQERQFQPPAEYAAMPAEEGLPPLTTSSMERLPLSDRRMIDFMGGKIPSRPEPKTPQETVRSYKLESRPETDQERLTKAESNQAYFQRTAETYQQKNDMLLAHISENPSPEAMKIYQERQTVADKYWKRAQQEEARAQKLQTQIAAANKEKELETLKQEGESSRLQTALDAEDKKAGIKAEREKMVEVQEQLDNTRKDMTSTYADLVNDKISEEAFVAMEREHLRYYQDFLQRALTATGDIEGEQTISDFIDIALENAARTRDMDHLEAIFIAFDWATGRGRM